VRHAGNAQKARQAVRPRLTCARKARVSTFRQFFGVPDQDPRRRCG
jgi:hypothetical protein